MTDAAILCPFCNSRLERRAATCPRCDARLPDDLVARLPETGIVAGSPPGVPPLNVPGKRKTIAAVLGVMAFMAILTTGFVLWTKDFRRQNDVKKGYVLTDPATQTPEEMTAVGLLPAKCSVIGAVNLADVRKNPVVKKALLDNPARPVNFLVDQLKDAGLSIDTIDQVAVGLDIAEVPPRIYVIAQTNKPYDAKAVIKAFAPNKESYLRGQPLVTYPLGQLGQGTAWCLDDRHIAFVFRIDPDRADLEAIPKLSREKLAGSPKKLQSLVKERVDRQSTLWLAGDLEKKDGLDALLVFADTRPYQEFLNARALALSLKPDGGDLVALAHVLADSAKSAAAMEAKLNELDGRGEKSKKVVAAPEGEEPWVSIQLRYDPSAIAEILSKGPAFRKKGE